MQLGGGKKITQLGDQIVMSQGEKVLSDDEQIIKDTERSKTMLGVIWFRTE